MTSHILCLHSSQSSGSQWRPLVRALAADLPQVQIHTPDLLGYGRADSLACHRQHNQDFRFEQELTALQELLQSIADQPLHLVGHSYGGALALRLARERQASGMPVASIALYEPVAFHLLEAGTPARDEIVTVAQQMTSQSTEQATQSFVDYWNYPGYFKALPKRVQALMVAKQGKVQADFSALLNEPAALQDYAALTSPGLLLHGTQSPASSQAVAALLATLPNFKDESVEAGHMAPVTAPELVVPKLRDFLLQQAR